MRSLALFVGTIKALVRTFSSVKLNGNVFFLVWVTIGILALAAGRETIIFVTFYSVFSINYSFDYKFFYQMSL